MLKTNKNEIDIENNESGRILIEGGGADSK
jgi:hypothetical protein